MRYDLLGKAWDWALLQEQLTAPEPSTPLQLCDPGVSEALVESAGLYRTIEDAYLGLEAAGANWGAIEHSGPEAFRAALHEAVEPYDPASGRVRMVATMGHLVARKP